MIGCIIQARVGSERLPEKILKLVDKKHSMLEFVLKQLEFSKKIDKIIVATTNLKNDDVVSKLAENKEISVFRGDSLDVLDRYYRCAKKFNIDTIVRINSDCPLVDPFVVDQMIDKFSKENFDFMSNHQPRSYPYGMDVEIFSFKTLENAWKNALLESEREHVSPFMYNHPDVFSCNNFKHIQNFSNIRITVDREKDLELIKKIIEKINSSPITLKEIITLYNEVPKLFLMNSEYIVDEGYKKSVLIDQKNNLKL